MYQPVYVITMAAGALVLNRGQVISNSHTDSAMTTMSHEYVAQQKCSREVRRSGPVGFFVITQLFSQSDKALSWWRHQMETFSALLAICVGNSPVPGEFPAQRPVTRSFDVFFDLRLNKRLGKQSWVWWFETLSRPLWCYHNDAGITRPDRVNLYGFHL